MTTVEPYKPVKGEVPDILEIMKKPIPENPTREDIEDVLQFFRYLAGYRDDVVTKMQDCLQFYYALAADALDEKLERMKEALNE